MQDAISGDVIAKMIAANPSIRQKSSGGFISSGGIGSAWWSLGLGGLLVLHWDSSVRYLQLCQDSCLQFLPIQLSASVFLCRGLRLVGTCRILLLRDPHQHSSMDCFQSSCRPPNRATLPTEPLVEPMGMGWGSCVALDEAMVVLTWNVVRFSDLLCDDSKQLWSIRVDVAFCMARLAHRSCIED